MIYDKDQSVAKAAVTALGATGTKEAIDALDVLLKDHHEDLPPVSAAFEQQCWIQCAAVEALGKLPVDDVLDILLRTLRNNFLYVQEAVERVFVGWNDPRIIPALIALLKEENYGNTHICSIARILAYKNAREAVNPMIEWLKEGGGSYQTRLPKHSEN